MKIKIKREGGFIGITSKANLDFDELTPEEQQAFNALAEQSLQTAKPQAENLPPSKITQPVETTQAVETNSRGFGLAPVPPVNENGLELAGDVIPRNTQPHQMRDAFSYSVSMRKDGKTVSVKFDDMNAPPEIVEIFQKYVQY